MARTCTSRYAGLRAQCQDRQHPEGMHHAHTEDQCLQWADGGVHFSKPISKCSWPPAHEVDQRAAELHTKAKAQREHLLAYAATEASDDEVPGLLAPADRMRSDMAAQPAPGPCPISPCDWDAEGTLDDHLFCHHGEDEARNALVRLALENDRLRVALEVAAAEHAKAIAARDKARSRAKVSDDIQRAEKQVFDTAIRDLGGEPVQVQNLYAQLNSRTRQWRQAQQEAEQIRAELDKLDNAAATAKAAGYQAAARDAADLLTGHGPDTEMIVSFLQQRGTELHERSATVRPEHDTQEG